MNIKNESSEFEVKRELEENRKNIQTLDELFDYLKEISNYNTGYGIAPRAIAQAALATAWYFSKCFGITGFQSGCVMWDFILDWSISDNKTGLKLVNYDDMLYPQYEYKFDKVITKDIWDSLQKQAKNFIENDSDYAHSAVINHWKSIANGEVPFGYKVVDK